MSKIKCLQCNTVLISNSGEKTTCLCDNRAFVSENDNNTLVGANTLDSILIFRDSTCQFESPTM